MKCELIIDEFFCNKDPKRHLIELDRSSIEYIPATYSFGTTNPQVYIDQSFSLTITGFKFRFKNLKLADDEYGLFLTNEETLFLKGVKHGVEGAVSELHVVFCFNFLFDFVSPLGLGLNHA